MLKKSDILAGTGAQQEVEIPSLGDTVLIRPLSSGEWARVQEALAKGITIDMTEARRGGKVDLGAVLHNDYKSDILICKMGLVEDYTEDELSRLPVRVVSEISQAIQDITGVSKGKKREDEMSSFRDERGGATDSVPTNDGGSASEDAG